MTKPYILLCEMGNNPTAISMFAGIGGICLGFSQAGFKIVWANERDHLACETYRYNLGNDYLLECDIRQINEADIPTADVLLAGFPCQSFSVGGAQRGFEDTRGTMFFEVIRIAQSVAPKVIFLENVENLMEHDDGRTFQVIYYSLAQLGYIVKYKAMPTQDYANIPQTRRRIYIVAFKDIAQCNAFRFPDPIPLTKNIFDFINPTIKQEEFYYFDENSDFGKRVSEVVTNKRLMYRIFNGSITRLNNGKCPTITASMNTAQNAAVIRDNYGVRRLTVKECLVFQGFPEDYAFPLNVSWQTAIKQIGNSVTVPVISRIANQIRQVL